MTGPAHDSPLDLAAAYALGALSPDEAQRFEAFLATSPEAQREVAEYREVAALLALGGEDAAPGARPARAGAGADRRGQDAGAAASRRRRRPAPRGAVARAGGQPARSPSASARALVSARGRLAALEAALARARPDAGPDASSSSTEREATLNSILEPGVQLFQLTASGDPEPGHPALLESARNIAPSSTDTGSSRCRADRRTSSGSSRTASRCLR